MRTALHFYADIVFKEALKSRILLLFFSKAKKEYSNLSSPKLSFPMTLRTYPKYSTFVKQWFEI